MKILIISYNFPPKTGGLENVVFNVWKALGKAYDVFAILPHAKTGGEGFRQTYRCPLPGLLFYFAYAFFEGFFLLLKGNYDVILSGSGLTCPVSIMLAKMFSKRVVTIVHGLDITYPGFIYHAMILYFLPKCDVVVSNSRSTAEKAVGVGVSDKKVVVIHPGVDYGMFQIDKTQEELKRKYDLENRRVILSAGRLVKRKGALEFIRYSMPDIIENVPDVIFLLVGEPPRESLTHKENITSLIKKETKKLGFEKYVRMMGKIDQKSLVEYYNLCDLFVLPVIPVQGDSEGFGIVCIEAGSAAKAVVGTDIGGIPDSVEDGRSGILVPPNNHKMLTREIIRLLEDSQMRNAYGEYGRKRVIEEFDWGIIGNEYINLLKRFENK